MSEWNRDPLPRDVRRTDPPHPPKPPARKDRAKWCKGKVGVEHTPEVAVPPNSWGNGSGCGWRQTSWPDGSVRYRWRICYHLWICTTCGKHLMRSVTEDECRSA